MLLKMERGSALGKSGSPNDGEEAGMEKPTSDEAGRGRRRLEAKAVSASEDADDLFGVVAGTGTSVDVGAGVDAVDKTLPM